MKLLYAVLWGPHVPVLILLFGVFCTVRGRFPQIRAFRTLPAALRDEGKDGGLSALSALSASLAGSLGVGNILGVAAALTAGGAGAVFWMWLSAFFGMATVYAESALSVMYRAPDAPGAIGYVRKALGKFPAGIYAAGCVLSALGMGTMAQTGAVSAALGRFDVPGWVSGLLVAALLVLCIAGGLSGAVRVTEKLVPFMAALFLLAAGAVLFLRADRIPAAFARIFREAFTLRAAAGGAAGLWTALTVGVSRGVFTNEAGLGSGTFALSAIRGKTPEQVGAVGALQVFLDTLVMCTVTALCLLVSPSAGDGAARTLASFSAALGPAGEAAVSAATALFAFATCVAWSVYGMEALRFFPIFANRTGRAVYVAFAAFSCFLGCILPFSGVLTLCDAMNGIMALPNLAAVFRLSGGMSPVFSPKFRQNAKKQ